jgi:hypothetical protein
MHSYKTFAATILKCPIDNRICASEESKPPSVRDGIQLSAIPELGWTSVISALFWLAPTGFRRFIRFPRDLSLAASSL